MYVWSHALTVALRTTCLHTHTYIYIIHIHTYICVTSYTYMYIQVNEVLDDQAMLRKYKKEIDQLKKKLRYTSAGGEKDMEICQMINQLQSLQVVCVSE